MKVDYELYRSWELSYSYPLTPNREEYLRKCLEMQSLPDFDHEKIISIDSKSNYGRVQKDKNNGY